MHHLVLTKNNSTSWSLYIDGGNSQTVTFNAQSYTPGIFAIGMFASASAYFNGSIDQVRIFNRALTQDEVAILYTEELAGGSYNEPVELPPQTYLPIKVPASGGVPSNLLEWKYPTLVEEYVKADKVEVSGEFIGKNACTAWVNFDGTTTPPTIRDIYNVSQVNKIATGIYDIYFENEMDNVNYVPSGMGAYGWSSSTPTNYTALTLKYSSTAKNTNKFTINSAYATTAGGGLYNFESVDIQIFGGKN